MTIVSRIRKEGFSTTGELIEFPSVLRGGRNLVPNSDATKQSTSYSRYDFDSSVLTNYIGKNATISFNARTVNSGVEGFVDAYLREDVIIYPHYSGVFSVDNEMKRYSFTFKLEESALNALSVAIRSNQYVSGNTSEILVEVNNVKLEIGPKPTPWTPAPEDLGLTYPDWVKRFGTSFHENGIVSGEIIEYPPELEGRRNLIPNSNDFSGYNGYEGTVAIKTYNVEVPEWGATDATRIQTNGGESILKLTPRINYKKSAKVTFSYWIKNNSDKEMELRFNGLNGASTSKLAPSEQRRHIASGTLRSEYDWFQTQFRTINVDDELDFTIWRAKLEIGDKVSNWTPAPEDLGLSYPESILSFGSSFSDESISTKEYVEYPQELHGGRNLLILKDINNLAMTSNNNLAKNSSYRGFYIPVKEGEVYSLSRKSTVSPNRFRYSFTTVEPDAGVDWFGGTGNSSESESKTTHEEITVPENANYLFVYLSNGNDDITKELEIKLEKGAFSTPWILSPEDMGLNYPDYIQVF